MLRKRKEKGSGICETLEDPCLDVLYNPYILPEIVYVRTPELNSTNS